MPEFRPQAKAAVLLGVFAITAMLYLGREFLMPLALAILIAFLLTPVVERLERWKLAHTPAVVITALAAVAVIGMLLYVVAGQLVDLAGALPSYKENLRAKAAALRIGGDSPITKVTETFRELSVEMAKEPAGAPPPPPTEAAPVPVSLVETRPSPLAMAKEVIGTLLGPLGTGALVVVFVIFGLLERRDLRDRFIHLVGRGQLRVTTQAIDDAAERVSRYLFAQFIVNVTYGIPVGIGLYFIGIPNAALWGILSALLRFVPYIGPWIAAAIPILLSFAIAPGWWPPVATIALFLTLELISNNLVEPWLYGSSTGLSATAIIVSAAFWTWLWGAGGLLLATPLTVCLAVLGKYVPPLEFLDVLLGDHPPIAAEQRFYQRLLAGDETELLEMVEAYAERGELGELFDSAIIPALRQCEQDYSSGAIMREERTELLSRVRDALESIEGFGANANSADGAVIIVPARSEGDSLAAAMLAHLVNGHGLTTTLVSHQTLNSEVAERLRDDDHRWLCVSALTTPSARAGRVLIRRLLGEGPHAALLGLWGANPKAHAADVAGVQKAFTLRDAARSLRDRAPISQPAMNDSAPVSEPIAAVS